MRAADVVRRFALVLAVLACSSCEFGPVYGCHDFGWNLSPDRQTGPPWKFFWGFVQSRASRDGWQEPVYAICAISMMENIPYNDFEINDGLITAIRGHRVEVSRSKKAVYELQPDGSLREISLSPEEIAKALEIFDNRHDKYSGLDPARTQAVFYEKIIPQLKELKVTESASSRKQPGSGFDPGFTPGFHLIQSSPSPAAKPAASPP